MMQINDQLGVVMLRLSEINNVYLLVESEKLGYQNRIQNFLKKEEENVFEICWHTYIHCFFLSCPGY